ncbi:unnamed protein product [Rotaria magnacalcarata]|uniref:Uncharacterized protein n=1 Tax=Rotaria magnacalcarata TaxID=392030 RepID=A0A816T6J6_9BILA|nr:unnamed protein product [Rotaria magnacalcarata]
MSFLVEIPTPIREDLNNMLLLGLWHGRVTPPSSSLLDKIVDNIKLLITTGINIYINNKMMHFMVNVQLHTGDFPARVKCNHLVNHNGFHACSRCLIVGSRCPQPCANHTLYLLSEWHNVLKQNPTGLLLINECLDGIKYSHTYNRRPRDFSTFLKWKASELRTFMLYMALPILVKLSLNMPDCFPTL